MEHRTDFRNAPTMFLCICTNLFGSCPRKEPPAFARAARVACNRSPEAWGSEIRMDFQFLQKQECEQDIFASAL